MSEAADIAPAAKPSSEASPGAVARSAVRGSAWTMGGFALGQLLRFLGNLVLARLLFPEVFGQLALVYTFTTGLALFSDVGSVPAVVQSPLGDDPTFLNTVWTIHCIRGAAIWLASFAIAGPVASFYGEPLLAELLPAVGFGAFLSGLESVSILTTRRHLRLERLTVVDLVSQAVGVAANVGFVLAYQALLGRDRPGVAWAIVLGGLLSSALKMVLTHTWLEGIRHRFLLDRASVRALFGYGRWVFVSTMLTFLANQSDRLIFGKLIPLDLLGVYGIGATLATLPSQAILVLGPSVIFPAFSRVAGRPDFAALYARARLPLLVAGATLVTGLLASGPFLVRVLYDARYGDAAWILQYLAVAAWFQILEAMSGAAVLAQGRVRWLTAANAAKLVAIVALVPLGFRAGGFPGALVGLVLADVAKYLTSLVAAARAGLHGLSRDLGASALIGLVAVAATLAGHAAARGPRADLLGFLAAGTVAAAPGGVLALWLLRRRALQRARSL